LLSYPINTPEYQNVACDVKLFFQNDCKGQYSPIGRPLQMQDSWTNPLPLRGRIILHYEFAPDSLFGEERKGFFRRRLDYKLPTLSKKSTGRKKQTPLMEQYFSTKAKHPDALVLFRVGDFYETFGEDAVKTANTLGIVLTKRNNGGSDIELAGFPYHSLDLYLPRLVKAGFRVAICEQLEKPSKEKKLVKRGVTEVVTPGVTFEESLLNHKSNNFLAAIHYLSGSQIGVAFIDVSTGDFLVSEGDKMHVEKLLKSLDPSEIVFSRGEKERIERWLGDSFYQYPLDQWIFTRDFAREKLIEQFQVQTLKGFGVEHLVLAQVAAGAALQYLSVTQNDRLQHINRIRRIHSEEHMWLDQFSIRNLELLHSPHPSGKTLIDILDKTITAMGGRLLKHWVLMPLVQLSAIQARHESVAHLIQDMDLAQLLEKQLHQIGDLERIVSRIPQMRITPREVGQLKKSLDAIIPLIEPLKKSSPTGLVSLGEQIQTCTPLRKRIEEQLTDEPPASTSKGGIIRAGYNKKLDELRHIVTHSKDLLVEIQQKEIERTGISSLKIGFNNVFGYYLEVTHKYKKHVPQEWVRKQTLTNAERYITDELKKLETTILGAQDKMLVLEEQLFTQLVEELKQYIPAIQQNARIIASVDCLHSFAVVSAYNNYVRPEMDASFMIDIKNGRHPVIEQHLPVGEFYVPNDTFLDKDTQQIMMITGPNMSGKSALLRQTALICIMAQVGCFVPADEARIGLIDKIFTRVGASDNISSGESTFMVEMNETSSIMNNISDRSLILLDEIGRGTSTYDGISIAWAIAEFLHENPMARPKTLFATHYHELNELSSQHERIKNFSISTKEVGQNIVFLRKLVPGGSNHSFGIHVAKLAGMPREIILRAQTILHQLEQKTVENTGAVEQPTVTGNIKDHMPPGGIQLSLFDTVDPQATKVKQMLLALEPNTMTPIECMLKLVELRKLLED